MVPGTQDWGRDSRDTGTNRSISFQVERHPFQVERLPFQVVVVVVELATHRSARPYPKVAHALSVT